MTVVEVKIPEHIRLNYYRDCCEKRISEKEYRTYKGICLSCSEQKQLKEFEEK